MAGKINHQYANHHANTVLQGTAYNSTLTQNNTTIFNSAEAEKEREPRYYVEESSHSQFMGREGVLINLQKHFLYKPREDGCSKSGSRRVCLVQGIGGTGKTEIALKFAEANRDSFWAILMVDARSQSFLTQSFRAIAQKASLLSMINTDEEAKSAVLSWLANLPKDRDWLLIFDGANDPEVYLEKYFPSGGRGAILITTTSPALSSLATHYEAISGLESDCAARLLLATAFEDIADENRLRKARMISEKLEGLPLPILHAGSIIRKGHCTMDNFLQKIEKHLQQWFISGEASEETSRYRWVYGTWVACRKMIQQRNAPGSGDALDLLTASALVDNKNIPLRLFEHMVPKPQIREGLFKGWTQALSTFSPVARGSSETPLWDSDRLRKAVTILADYSLVSFNSKSSEFSIHGSVHQWLCLDLKLHGEDSMHSWAKSTVNFGLAAHIDLGQRSRKNQKDRAIFSPHVRRFLEQNVAPFEISQVADEHAAKMYSFLCLETGHYDLAERCCRMRMLFNQTPRKSTKEKYFDALVSLAEVLERCGQFTKALEASREANTGLAAMDLASPLISKNRQLLALSLKGINRISEAKQELQALLAATSEDPEQADEFRLETVAILAQVLRREGDFAGAIEKAEQCYKDRTRVLGIEHQDTLESARTLATTLLEHGSKLSTAAKIMEHVCKAREKILGANRPDTILSFSTLARILKKQGNYARAETELTKALSKQMEVREPNHPDTLSMTNSLGDISLQKQHFEEAEARFQMAYLGYLENDNFGPGHPHTLTAKTNVAISLQHRGDLDKANCLYNEVVEECRRSGRDTSLNAIHCMMNQSELLTMQRDFVAAEELARKAAEGYRVTHGENSAAYFSALTVVSRPMQSQKRYEEAEQLLSKAKEGLAAACGPENPMTLNTTALLAHVVSKQGRDDESLSFFQEASNGFRKIGDDKHWCHKRWHNQTLS